MNKLLKLTMAGAMACGLLAGCSSSSADTSEEAKELIFATSPDYPPYESIEDGKIVGFDPDMAEWLVNYMNENGGNYTYEWKEMSFDTIVSAVQTGQVDVGIAGFTYEEDRTSAINFSDPYNDSAQVILVKGDSGIASSADLNGKTVGVQLGTTAESAAAEIEGADVVTNKDVKILVEMLKGDQIDAIVLDKAPAAAYAEANDFVVLDEVLLQEENYIILNKDDEELLKEMNAAIDAFVKSDDYVALKEEWGV
jgi:polar amino acid transport system substrate-binding protein